MLNLKNFLLFIGALGVIFLVSACQADITEQPASYTGKVVNITVQQNCTRQSIGASDNIVLESFLVEKLKADTMLLIEGTLSGFGADYYAMTQGWKYGDGKEVIGQSVMFEDTDASSKIYSTNALIKGHTQTGKQLMSFRYFSKDGSAASRPFFIYNPNASDDKRLDQTCSIYTIWEIKL